MERLNTINEIRETLMKLRTLDESLKEHFSLLAEALDAEKFLEFERLNSVRNILNNLINEENSCRDLYERIFNEPPPETFAEVENFLIDEEVKILETSIYGRARKFLRLATDLPEYQKTLMRHQKKLQALFGKKDFNTKSEEIAEPYAKFIDAMNATTTGEKILAIQELRETFDVNFIGAGLFDGDLVFKDYNAVEEEFAEKIPDESEESDFVKILREKDALLTDDDFAPWKNFVVEKNERDKEFSAKRFKSDFKNTSLLQTLISTVAIRGCASASVAPSKLFTTETFENAAQTLLKKGYLQKFSFGKLGNFYGMTKKFYEFARSESGKKFINSITTGYKNSSQSIVFIDEDVRVALTRAIYFHIYEYAPESEKYSITAEFFSQSFRTKLLKGKERGLLLGCFWDDFDECDKFIKKFQQHLREMNMNFDCIVVAGLTTQHAEKIFAALKTTLDEFFAKITLNVYFYSAADDAFYTADTLEKITPEEFFAPDEENSPENEIEPETFDDESVDETEDENFDKPAEEIDDDDSFDAEAPDEILPAVRKMIVNKKFYCATAYLKAQSLQNADVEPLYRRLAFALDDPLLDAAYNSNEIFMLYDGESSVFDESLIIAAALRAFFYNRTESDYGIADLYEEIKNLKLLRNNVALAQVIHDIAEFKIDNQKGAEYFAKYRTKDTRTIKKKLAAIVREAEDYFNRVFEGDSRGDKLTFAKTKQLLFAPDGEFCKMFTAVKTPTENIDAETVNALKDFLSRQFLRKNGKTDKDKLQDWIEACWNKVKDPSRSDAIVGKWRNNLVNNLERAAEIMSAWLECAENLSGDEFNPHEETFANISGNIAAARKSIYKAMKDRTLNAAGFAVLEKTLCEISDRLTGVFNPCEHEYFYVEFLCGDEVILNENCLPKFDLNTNDGTNILLPEQIERHAKQKKLPSIRERIEFIFKRKGDNFGTAKILDTYLQKTEGKSFIAEQGYRVEETVNATAKDAAREREDFTGGVAFAQIHGQLQFMPETKETILQIIDSCYDYAEESKNYGVFFRVKNFWDDAIKQNSAALADNLKNELAQAVEEYKLNVVNFDDDKLRQSIADIEEIISLGIFPKAQECIRDLKTGELYEKPDDDDDNTLNLFFEDYDDCRRRVQDVSTSLENLLGRSSDKNKFDKAKSSLIESWLPNGMRDTDAVKENIRERVKNLLTLLGFEVESVDLLADDSDAKSLTYEVKLKKSFQIRHNHPAAVFGSGAEADKAGFRVTCLFGQFPQENLIDYFKRFDKGHTLILLDDALKPSERRRLAKAIKADKSLMHVFAVIDRVVIMYLLKHCAKQIGTKRINDTLMALIMPFSRYQPYIWEPNKPLPPEMFIGREAEMNKVKSPDGVNIVYGGRQLGKSALLKMARRQLDGNNNQRAILVEIRKQDFEEAALSVSRELSAKKFFTEKFETNDWDELARAIQARLSSTEPTKISYFLLMLDEADTFIETCAEIDYEPISALSRIQREDYNGTRFKFVIAGLHNVIRYDKRAQENNGILPTLPPPLTITPFRFEEARKLLEVPLRYLGLRFPNDKFIYTIEETALYYPGLIQLFCEKLLLTLFDSNDYGADTPPYDLKETHIRKILSDKDFLDSIKERINITLKLEDDKYYYVIAQLLAYLYHKTLKVDGYTPREILSLAKSEDFEELLTRNLLPDDEDKINALMLELCKLNILRESGAGRYKFSSQSIYRYMGTAQQIDEELFNLMTEVDNG